MRKMQMTKAKVTRPIYYPNQYVCGSLRREGAVTLKWLHKLDRLVSTIYKNTASMTEALLRAANSKLIDPEFIKKLAALKDNLEVVAAATEMYKKNNKEHGTLQLIQDAMVQLDEAVEHFAYFDKLLDLERAEL